MTLRLSLIVLLALAVPRLAVAQMPDKSGYLQSSLPFFESHVFSSPDASVNEILEDSDGFIWAATDNGITRFDGIYSHSFFAVDTTSLLRENAMISICDDTLQNKIWAVYTTKQRIVSIDKKTYQQQTIDYTFADVDSNDMKIFFRYIINFNDSLLLGATSYGLCFVNKNTSVATALFRKGSDEYRNYNNLFSVVSTPRHTYLMNSGKLYFIASGHSPEDFTLEQFDIETSDLIRHLDEKNDSILVLDCWNTRTGGYNLYEYNVFSRRLKFLTHTTRTSHGIACMDDGVWICTNAGLQFYNFESQQLRSFNTFNSSLADNKLTCITRSRRQPIIWLGYSEGIIKNDYFSSKFSVTDLRRFSDSESSYMTSVHRDSDGGTWAWFMDGMFYRAPDSNFFLRHPMSDIIGRLAVLQIEEDPKRGLLYLLSNTTLFVHNRKTNQTKEFDTKGQHINHFGVLSNGEIIGYTREKNLFHYYPETNKIDFIQRSSDVPKFSAIENDGDTIAWLGDDKGNIYSFDVRALELKHHIKLEKEDRKVDAIKCSYRNGEKELWVVASRAGLFYYQPRYGKATSVKYDQQLNTQIASIEIDEVNNVWLATRQGIMCINNQDGQIYSYDKSDYSLCPQFNRNASCVDKDGNVIMGGANYFVEFNSENFSENTHFPAPRMVSYRFANATDAEYDALTRKEYYAVSDTIEVPAGVRSISLFIRMLNYSKPLRNHYQWRMPDIDDKWHDAVTASPLSFPTLEDGYHLLEMRSCAANGLPTENYSSLVIKKSVFFYQRTGFKVLCWTMAFALLLFAFWVKLKIEERQKRLLEAEVERQAGAIKSANISLLQNKEIIEKQNSELVRHRDHLEAIVEERTADLVVARERAEESDKLKSAFLANLSHEVRTPMNCIVGFAKLLADPTCTTDEHQEFVHLIQESSNALLVLLGDLLDVSRIETGQLRINIAPFDLYKELVDVFKLLEVERKATTYDFVLDVDPALEGLTLPSDKDRFRQIIINLTYNAFKFTEQGEVRITARLAQAADVLSFNYPTEVPMPPQDDLLFVSVKDTGIGMPADKLDVIFEPFRKLSNNKTLYPGLGLGLNIVKNLTSVLGGFVWVDRKSVV